MIYDDNHMQWDIRFFLSKTAIIIANNTLHIITIIEMTKRSKKITPSITYRSHVTLILKVTL